MKRFVTAFLTIALRAAFAAPDADFAVPVIGHVYDAASHAVRRMTGTPGAATRAPALRSASSIRLWSLATARLPLCLPPMLCSCCGSLPQALKPAASRIRLLRSTKEH